LLRAEQAVAVVSANQIVGSLILFAMIYALLFAVFIHVLHQKIVHGPEEPAEAPPTRRAIPQLTNSDQPAGTGDRAGSLKMKTGVRTRRDTNGQK